MRTLLLHDAADDTAVALALETAGHTIVRCQPGRHRTFPCVGLDGRCPLDGTVDVAVVVHDSPTGAIDPDEVGVICALRDGIPLVVAGNGAMTPFRELATAVAAGAGDVDGACRRAATARARHLGQLVGGHVTVSGGQVRATLPTGSTPADAVRAHQVLVGAVPRARAVDVVLGPE